MWHKVVLRRLEASRLFSGVGLVGAKVRAVIDEARFLDIHYDPTTESYSYALIDIGLPYPGDKRLFGWDDHPHEGVVEIEKLKSYPQHFQKLAEDGSWIFEASPMRGDIEREIDTVVAVLRAHLQMK